MRIAVFSLLFLALGCNQRTVVPAKKFLSPLRLANFGCTEAGNQLPFALSVANDGADVLVDEIQATTLSESIFGDTKAIDRPKSFQGAVALIEPMGKDGVLHTLPVGKEIRIKGGQTSDVWALFVWNVPDAPAPQLAVLTAKFALRHNGLAVLTTPPYTFILQSRPGVLNSLMNDRPRIPANDVQMLQLLKSQRGKPSDSVKDLIRRLETLTRKI